MKKFYENKIFIIVSLFLIFGAVAVIASTIGDSGYSGIQVDNYFTGNGKQGITQNVSFSDSENNEYSLQFEDGLLINYSFGESLFPSEGLVAYYKLDNNDFSDELGNYPLTNNGTANASGIIIDGRDFESGDPDSLQNTIYSSPGYTDDFSASMWINLEFTSQAFFSFGKSSGDFQITGYIQSGGIVHALGATNYVGPDTILTGTTIGTGVWHHVVITYDGDTNNLTLYENGTQTDSDTVSSTASGGSGLLLGRRYDNDIIIAPFDGVIDEVGIWNRVLNPTEIQTLYNNGKGLTYN